MKIAQVVCVFPPYKSGIGNVAFSFAKILGDFGYSVSVLTPERRGEHTKKGENFNIVRLNPLIRYGHGAFLPQLLFKLPKFDIVHLHYPFFGSAEIVWLAKILLGNRFKLIIHYHMDTTGLSWLVKILSLPSKLIRNSLFRRADIITCASIDYIRNSSIKNIYKKYPDKFKEIPFGVDSKCFYPGLDKREKSKNILFVGGLDRAHYFKGLNVLIKAFGQLLISDIKLIIVGDGDLRPTYERQAKILGIASKVNFVGGVNGTQLVKYYQDASVLVLPSINKNEAFGLVLLEAMACGIPVIASNLPGVRSVFQDKIHGLLVEPGNVDDLKDKLGIILDDNNKRNRMGIAGRKLVEEKFTWLDVKKKLEKIYENLFNQQFI